jgi:hypothetical protein
MTRKHPAANRRAGRYEVLVEQSAGLWERRADNACNVNCFDVSGDESPESMNAVGLTMMTARRALSSAAIALCDEQ